MVSVSTPGLSGSARPTRHGAPSGLAPIARISPILTSVVDRPALRSLSTTRSVAYPCAMPFSVIAAPRSASATAVLAHKQAAVADLRQRFSQLLRRWPFRIGPIRGEMIRIKLPQRLHCRIERAAGQFRKRQRRFQQRHHVGVGSNKYPGAVEGADRGVRLGTG